jgi:hypothetical protein
METVRQEALAPRGVLGVHPAAGVARHLHERAGWKVVETGVQLEGGPPFRLMGHALP